MFERLQAKKKDNKGFSLVELIIVIAIMAILVGVVGTQVVPYLNKSKAAKDQQILSAFCTAAVSAYSYQADKVSETSFNFDYFAVTGSDADGATDAERIKKEMENLITYTSKTDLASKMSSTYGQSVKESASDINIAFDFSKHTCTVTIKTNSTSKPVVEKAEATL